MSIINYMSWGIVFLLFGYSFYHFSMYISEKRYISDAYERLQASADERKKKEEERMQKEGNREKIDFLTWLDMLITQSGIKKKIPFFTAEVYACFAILLGVICFAVVLKVTDAVTFAFIGGGAGILSTYVYMQVLINENIKSIEEDMNVFLDLISTYSKSSDDIVDILSKVYPFLHEPLSGYLQEFYFEAINAGAETAFLHLRYKMPHRKMNEVLGNLEMCSTRLTDYSNIARDSQEQFMVYLEGKKERADAKINGGMELLIFLLIAIIAFYVMGSFAQINIIDWFANTLGGRLLLAYFGVLALCGVLLVSSFDKG